MPRVVQRKLAVFFVFSLRILTPPMETPDPPSDTPGASKKVFLTPHDIPWSLRVVCFLSGLLCFFFLCGWNRVRC